MKTTNNKNNWFKRFATATLMSLGTIFTAQAQDVIHLTNGTKVDAKVLEITSGTIRYEGHSNPGGPVYVLRRSEVEMIVYENGTVEEFTPAAREKREEEKKKLVTPGKNGFYVEGKAGISQMSRDLQAGSYYNEPGYGTGYVSSTGEYSEMFPTIGLRFGSKFYLKNSKGKFVHGMHVNWLDLQVNLQRMAGINLGLFNPGYSGLLKLNDNSAVEFCLTTGFNMLARDISSRKFGYFIVPEFSPIYGYHITPAIKFQQNGFVVGIEFQYAGTFNSYDNVRYSSFGFSIGRKF